MKLSQSSSPSWNQIRQKTILPTNQRLSNWLKIESLALVFTIYENMTDQKRNLIQNELFLFLLSSKIPNELIFSI